METPYITEKWDGQYFVEFTISAPDLDLLREYSDAYLRNYGYGGYGTRVTETSFDETTKQYITRGSRYYNCE